MLPNSLLLWQRRLVHESLIEVIWEHLTLPVVARLIVAINHPLNGLKCFFRVDPGNQALACTKESMGRGRWYAVACICKTDHLQNRPSANQTNQPNLPKTCQNWNFQVGTEDSGFALQTCVHTSGFVTSASEARATMLHTHTNKDTHTYYIQMNTFAHCTQSIWHKETRGMCDLLTASMQFIFSDRLFLYQKSDNPNFGRDLTGTSDQIWDNPNFGPDAK